MKASCLLPPHFAGERADVVGDEPVHGRNRTRRRRVPRRGHTLADLEPVVVVDRAEQLGVGVVPLLTRVRVGRVQVGSDAIGHHLAPGAVLGPSGDRVAQLLPDDTLKRLAIPRPVEAAQHVVQRPVLKQHHHHMIERVVTGS
jgi:hypothetical protein